MHETPVKLRWRDERWPLAALAALLTTVYAVTMSRTVTLEDAGAFISVAYYGGLAHPPGYPLHSRLSTLFAQIPLGSVALRVQWVSALAGAGACCCLYLCARLLGARRVAATAAALALGLSDTFWSQAIVAEVYALHACLYFLVLALCLRLDAAWSQHWLRATAFAFGLALTNHWPLMLLGAPAFAAAIARPGHIRERAAACLRDSPALLACFACGLLPYLYLPIRSAYEPEMMTYGPVRSLAEFGSYVARSHYAVVEQSVTAGLSEALRYVGLFFSRVASEFSQAGAPFVVAGFLASFAFLPRHRAVALLLGFLSSSVLLKLFYAVDYDDLYAEAYLVYQTGGAFGSAALYLACAFFWLDRVGRGRRALALGAALLVLVPCGLRNFQRNQQRNQTFAFDYARTLLELLPRDAVLLAYADADLGPLAYAHHVEGVRPDVRLYSQMGNLFGNRLFSPREVDTPRARAALEDLVLREGRAFLTWDATGLLQVAAFRHYDHGPLHEVVAEPRASFDLEREELRRRVVPRARSFLDRAWESLVETPERIRWSYYWDGIVSGFCAAVIRDGGDHPIVDAIPRCRWAKADLLWVAGDLDAAGEIYHGLLRARGFQLHEKQVLYARHLQLGLERIHAASGRWVAEPTRYQELADEVRSVVDAYPACSNPTLLGLLDVRSHVEIDIDLPALRARFGGCPNLRRLWQAETPAATVD
jgi:hypothetical protein